MSLNQRATAEFSTLYTKCSSSPLTYPSKQSGSGPGRAPPRSPRAKKDAPPGACS
jgi:hypothetical protein